MDMSAAARGKNPGVAIVNICAHLLIGGRVQYVGFRYYCCIEARRLGVTGWVRNLSDGRVEVMVEGEQNVVREFVGLCRRGPSGARVTTCEEDFTAYVGEFRDFEVK